MRSASSLHLFQPPSVGDEVSFQDGSKALVCQDIGCGWYLQMDGKRFCQSGFDMNSFIRSVLDEDRSRAEAA